MVFTMQMSKLFTGAEKNSEPILTSVHAVLRDGTELTVSKDELQFLIVTRQVRSFERSDGWVVCGQDKDCMRNHSAEFDGKDRREHTVYDYGYWY